MTTPTNPTAVLPHPDPNKTATVSCAVRFRGKTVLTCGNTIRHRCLVDPAKRQPNLTQNRRSDAVLCCLSLRERGFLRTPTPSPGRAEAPETRSCRVCGCTDITPCTGLNDQACWWIEPDLCSQCRPHAEACS